MKLLLDTHVFIWWVEGDSRLSPDARAAIADPRNSLLLSIASLWEMSIKVGTGKLKLGANVEAYVEQWTAQYGISFLAIERHHAFAVANLPTHHRDPFDRLLISQAINEQLTLVSGDSLFQPYAVPLIW